MYGSWYKNYEKKDKCRGKERCKMTETRDRNVMIQVCNDYNREYVVGYDKSLVFTRSGPFPISCFIEQKALKYKPSAQFS